jgi:hypothetical protein
MIVPILKELVQCTKALFHEHSIVAFWIQIRADPFHFA